MGVEKTITKEGTGVKPNPGQTITMQYTGWISKENWKKGDQ